MVSSRTAAGLVFGLAVVTAPFAAQAHRSWMVPSSTVLSGQEAWVTVDAAVSNTLFHPDHVAMRVDGVSILGPDGELSQPQNAATGKFRSTFDAALTKAGTYKIFAATEGLSASYKLNGEAKRWRGQVSEAATAIPAGATEGKLTLNQRRIETFVTLGQPSAGALKPTGKGLELEPITHPNDLVAGETARFRLLLDGKPAAGLEVEVAPGNARYRAAPDVMNLKTGTDGVVQISWPEPGMYWLEASARGGPSSVPNTERVAAYVATFEVLPN